MAKKNKIDINESLFWQQYHASPTIAEMFPGVASLIIKMTFHEDGGDRVIESRTEDGPISQRKAFFRIKCLQRECVNGGFDLTSAVASAIHLRKDTERGRLVCQGWQDQERVGKYHCLWDLEYEIIVKYK
jgi:hypothetical protein